MSHHLGNAFRTDTCRNQERSEAMPCLMVGQVLLASDDDAQFMYLKPHHIPAWQGEDGLRVIGRVIQVDNLLGYRMQGNECLYFRLPAVNPYITPSLSRPSYVVRIKQLRINIGKPRKTREDESPSSQFFQWVILWQFKFQ